MVLNRYIFNYVNKDFFVVAIIILREKENIPLFLGNILQL